MQLGNLQRAFEVLHEALHVLHNTCGPMHATTASTYYTLAMIYYHMGDYCSAMAYQQKGIVILEKIHGLDDPEGTDSEKSLQLEAVLRTHSRGMTFQNVRARHRFPNVGYALVSKETFS